MQDNDVVIQTAADQGRYMVAGRDLRQGEVILSEYPLVAGPLYTRSKPVCLGCLRLVAGNTYRCGGCGLPVCDAACEQAAIHRQECKVFQAAGFKLEVEDWTAYCPIYSCITILRALLLQETDPAAWSVIDSLMDHEEERVAKDSPTWRVHELLVVSFVNRSLNLQQFSQPQIR